MGEKYEALPFKTVYGYHDQSRPTEGIGGRCDICKLEVWLRVEVEQVLYPVEFRTKLVHFSCR